MITKRASWSFLPVVTLVLVAGLLAPTTVGEPEGENFPFEGAKVVYQVGGTSPLGPVVGTMAYSVKTVSRATYEVELEMEGNIDKLPGFGSQGTSEVELGDPIAFEGLIAGSKFVKERSLDRDDREIVINEYYLEEEKERGEESVSSFIPEEVEIPLLVNYRYGDEYRITIELSKTNVGYLQ